MKKYLIAFTLLVALTIGQTTVVLAQHSTDNTELVDTAANSDDSLEAYSDTTRAAHDSTVVSRHHRVGGYVYNDHFLKDAFGNIGIDGLMGMTFVVLIVLIIFVISPLVILAVLLFFIYKNRKQKMRMAEMALKQGQPIPDELLTEHRENDNDLWQRGLRQTFLGVGLLAFFGYLNSTLGIGIGILVTCIGLGKLAIVKTSRKE